MTILYGQETLQTEMTPRDRLSVFAESVFERYPKHLRTVFDETGRFEQQQVDLINPRTRSYLSVVRPPGEDELVLRGNMFDTVADLKDTYGEQITVVVAERGSHVNTGLTGYRTKELDDASLESILPTMREWCQEEGVVTRRADIISRQTAALAVQNTYALAVAS